MQRLTRWGNSIGLRIPAPVLEGAGLQAGDYCYVRLLDSGDIRLRPVRQIIAADPIGDDPAPMTDEEVAAKW